ncbi:M35 family metallo-endopeptidase [Burkholderia pyrrocinia]|uniref:M35 family metallo-endopeptidase n=1 Tax=Burkholderia pyrrocinia TaxID=60550 RepID=UPI00215B5848|nr:M35 family metallo-endopeptidase [Burkholderia pyrrocinia]UVE63934.1 M35 family metallo-endopeptidase [Burkholderia pyrrocinia]
MNDFSDKNKYDFEVDENEEWVLVHSGAVTNTNPGSMVHVPINTTPICPNMSNQAFRSLIMRLRDTALILIAERTSDLARWDKSAKNRVQFWFGRSDETIRQKLSSGLHKLAAAMRELEPEKIIRWDEQHKKKLTCSVVPDTGTNDASVCKPDSARRIIAIYPHFCTVEDVYVAGNCKLKILIHECSHYTDTFDADDVNYGFARGIGYWAQNDPEGASRNADSIACYVAHFDDMDEFKKKKIW